MKGILKRWIALSLSFMLMCAAIPVRAQENEMDMQNDKYPDKNSQHISALPSLLLFPFL